MDLDVIWVWMNKEELRVDKVWVVVVRGKLVVVICEVNRDDVK